MEVNWRDYGDLETKERLEQYMIKTERDELYHIHKSNERDTKHRMEVKTESHMKELCSTFNTVTAISKTLEIHNK